MSDRVEEIRERMLARATCCPSDGCEDDTDTLLSEIDRLRDVAEEVLKTATEWTPPHLLEMAREALEPDPVNLTNDVSPVRDKDDTSGQHGAGDADSTSGAQDGLVERVVDALREAYGDCDPWDTLAAYRAIREVADWCEEHFDSHGINTMPNFLRAQLEDSDA